ncbi:MAG: phage tail terminator-like protein [Gammaproteobacteria bacterium]
MSHARARQAIEVKLVTWAAAYPIKVANFEQGFEPAAGETYLRGFLLPGPTTCRYLGGDAYEYAGVYQVSIICPSGEPLATPEALIKALSDLFPVDSELSRSGFEGLIIEPVEQGPTITEPTTYTVPASISYRGVADLPTT